MTLIWLTNSKWLWNSTFQKLRPNKLSRASNNTMSIDKNRSHEISLNNFKIKDNSNYSNLHRIQQRTQLYSSQILADDNIEHSVKLGCNFIYTIATIRMRELLRYSRYKKLQRKACPDKINNNTNTININIKTKHKHSLTTFLPFKKEIENNAIKDINKLHKVIL